MFARVGTAFVALLVSATCAAQSQDAVIWVDVGKDDPTLNDEIPPEEIEQRHTPELVDELQSLKEDTLLLYTEYTSKAGSDLKTFLTNVTNYIDIAVKDVGVDIADGRCRATFDSRLHKIEVDAQKAASFSADNHHKFLLGHMVVFRIHLNKSEDYIKRCDKAVKGCGVPCETTSRVKRWRRMASEEIHRVQDDLQHSRRSYRDIVNHARRRLNHLRKQITLRAQDAVFEYQECVKRG